MLASRLAGGRDARRRGAEVVDVRVQLVRGRRRAGDHGEAALRDVALDAAVQRVARDALLEAHLVPRVGVRHVELVGCVRPHGHVEDDRADAGDVAGAGYQGRRAGIGVDDEDVAVGEIERHLAVPAPIDLVHPGRAVELDDEPGARRAGGGARGRRRQAAVAADRGLGDRRRAVPRVERRREDPRPVGRARQRARRVAEEHDVGDGRPAERRPEASGVEHLDHRTPLPAGGEVGQNRAILPAPRRRDEGACAARTGEHDVARLVAGEQRARHA